MIDKINRQGAATATVVIPALEEAMQERVDVALMSTDVPSPQTSSMRLSAPGCG